MPRTLPAPLSGVYAARRPTGLILGTLIPIVAIFGGLMVPALVYSLLTGSGEMPSWMTIVAFGTVVLIIFGWVRFKEGRPAASLGFNRGTGVPKQLLRGAGAGVGLVAIIMLLLVVFGQAEIHWNGGALSAGQWGLALVWVGVFAVQGSAEEIVMRGFAFQAYARRLGVVAALIGQAVLFAAMHGQNDGMGPLPLLNLVLVGIAFGCWAVAEGSLWGVCAFHASWNWALLWLFGSTVSGQGSDGGGIFAVTLVGPGSDLLTGGVFGMEASLITTGILAIVVLALLRPVARAMRAARTSVNAHEAAQDTTAHAQGH